MEKNLLQRLDTAMKAQLQEEQLKRKELTGDMLKSYQGELRKFRKGIHLRDLRLKEQKTLIANLRSNLASTQTNLKHLKIVCLMLLTLAAGLAMALLMMVR